MGVLPQGPDPHEHTYANDVRHLVIRLHDRARYLREPRDLRESTIIGAIEDQALLFEAIAALLMKP